MRVNIRNIPPGGVDVEEIVLASDLDLEASDFEFNSPLRIQAHLEKADDVLIVGARVSGSYIFHCSRCLEPFPQDRCEQLKFYLDITPRTNQVELGEDIRQEMLLALNPTALCRPDCRGICPNCGVNRNQTPCDCADDPSAPVHLKLED